MAVLRNRCCGAGSRTGAVVGEAGVAGSADGDHPVDLSRAGVGLAAYRGDLPRAYASRRSAVGAFVLALILGVLGCASGFNSRNVNTWLLDQDMAVCERTPLPENSERFTCTLSIIYSTQIYVLEGPREGPFYRLVEVRMVGS